MVNIPVITKRELSAYFLSPIAYVVLTGFALAHGLLFSLFLAPTIDPTNTAQWAFGLPLWLLIVAVPLLTMRLLSEETANGTIETLMTAPVTEIEVVLGKFVGALVFVVVLFAPILVEVVYLSSLGPVDPGPVLSGFLGLILLSALFIAIGLLCSAVTRMQVAAGIVSFVMLLGSYFLWTLSRDAETSVSAALRYISPPWHYISFTKGIVDTRDLAYFGVTTAVFLFLTVKALELRKWR